jgi:2-dehydro-3-deoxygluconokinase
VLTKGYGGDTFNTTCAAARLGSEVGYITRLGTDPFAHGLRQLFSRNGFPENLVKTTSGKTGLYFVSIGEDGQRTFHYDRQNSAASTLSESDVSRAVVEDSRIVFSSGITLAISPAARRATIKAFQMAREAGVMTAFDINYRKALWQSREAAFEAIHDILPYVDILLPSVQDIDPIYQFNNPESILDYFSLKGTKLIVLKMGEDGCYLRYKDTTEVVPALRGIPVIDTTGAGDAFNGGFLHGMTSGYSLIDCARLGNITAGLKVQTRGSALALPTREAVYAKALAFGLEVAPPALV